MNLEHNVASFMYLYELLNGVWAPQASFTTGKHSLKHEASKYHWKTKPVAGLSVLHLAGGMAKEDGHVPLH